MSPQDPHQQYDRWLAEHRGLMLKVVYSFTSNQSDQDDLLQEIAVALWKSIPQYRGNAKESTWVYKVALFTATTWSRRERRRSDSGVANTERLSEQPKDSRDPRQEWLFEMIRSMPDRDRTLILSSLEGYSHEQIAELTGMSHSGVGVRLHRIKKDLARLATEQFDDV